MNGWPTADARSIVAAEEVRLATRRTDGSLRTPTTIWIVGDGDRIFVRSTHGRTAAWFRGALATGAGRLTAGGRTFDVAFTEADGADLSTVDNAYRTKYRRYAPITEHLAEPGPRAATLQVHPA